MATMYKPTIMMCKPSYYRINYQINPWMNLNNNSEFDLAQKQWKLLHSIIGKYAQIKLIEPIKLLPDMVFTANAAFIYKRDAFISNFKHSERKLEACFFKPFLDGWFDTHSLPVPFEGAGDILCELNSGGIKNIYAGYGFRTQKEAYEYIHPFISGDTRWIYCELVDPRFYHLDTCFCPLPQNIALIYPPAFSSESYKQLKKHTNLIEVSEEEAEKFVCNAVVIGQNVILPSGCPKTVSMLKHHNLNVHECSMSEFIKAGGACKCLTLYLGDMDDNDFLSNI